MILVLDIKYHFTCGEWNLYQNLQVFMSLIVDYLEYSEFNKEVHFFCFQPEIHFWTNLVQKVKTVTLGQNLVLRLIRI